MAISSAAGAAAAVGIGVGVVGAITNVVGMVKNLDDMKDNTRKRWIDLNNRANISGALSQEERDELMEKRNNILDKYPDKNNIPEGDLWELAKIQTLMNGQNCDIKSQTIFAVENIKNVEMRQNVFENQLKAHGEMLVNHENRIGRLENTVDLHSKQISVLQTRVDNHELRIGKLEGTVNQHSRQIMELRNTVDIHTQQISFLKCTKYSNIERKNKSNTK